EAVCLYIARDTPSYAELFARWIFQATDRLAAFPRLGRVVPEIGRDDIREVIVQSYRVTYRLLPDSDGWPFESTQPGTPELNIRVLDRCPKLTAATNVGSASYPPYRFLV